MVLNWVSCRFVKACVIGLKNYPAINAEIQGEEIVYKIIIIWVLPLVQTEV